MEFDLPKIQEAHARLLSEYVSVVKTVESEHWYQALGMSRASRHSKNYFKIILTWCLNLLTAYFYVLSTDAAKKGSRWCTPQSFVKIFIYSHIRQKLKRLRVIYSQSVYLIRAEKPSEQQETGWLIQASEDCKNLDSSIPSWDITLPTITKFLTFPVVIGSLVKMLEQWAFETVKSPEAIIATLLTVLCLPMYVCVPVISAFSYKRGLLLKSLPIPPFQPWKPEMPEYPRKNTYSLENDLFHLIDRRKHKEAPYDLVGIVIMWMSYAVSLCALTQLESYQNLFPVPPFNEYMVGYVIVISVAMFWGVLKQAKKRDECNVQ